MVRFAFHSPSAKNRRRRQYLNRAHGYDFGRWDDLDDVDGDLPETPFDAFPVAPQEWTRTYRGRFRDLSPYDEHTSPLPRTTRTHRDGLVFENELYDMTAATKPLVAQHLGADAILEEVAYGSDWYRTDLVACCIDERKLKKRYRILGHGETLADPVRRAKAFFRLSARPAMPKETFVYERGVGYSESTARKCWDYLHGKQFIAETPRGFTSAVNLPDPVTAHAIELKPNDWRKALEQAERADGTDLSSRYSTGDHGFADHRWVALDAGGNGIDDALDNLDAFREAGVGLLSIDRGGLVELVDADACDPPSGLDRFLVSERAVEAADVVTPPETDDAYPVVRVSGSDDDGGSDDQISLTSF